MNRSSFVMNRNIIIPIYGYLSLIFNLRFDILCGIHVKTELGQVSKITSYHIFRQNFSFTCKHFHSITVSEEPCILERTKISYKKMISRPSIELNLICFRLCERTGVLNRIYCKFLCFL